MIVFDSDDFGCDHVISDMCQSHDCRDILLELKNANPAFKATLFAIPGEMTPELILWAVANRSWIELAVHGIFHRSNYECAGLTAEQFKQDMAFVEDAGFIRFFAKGFKAPGWQISDGVYQWLKNNGWWVADQAYNDERRPTDLPVYKIGENSIHTHTWNCVGNGVYELYDQLVEQVKDETDFKFVSEVVNA
jgi:hypothetical protein